jgi:hypothetical protein
VTVALTRAFDGLRSSNVLEEIVDAFIPSLNVAVTGVAGSTLVAAAAGDLEAIVGGVESGGAAVVKTTSTQ